MKVRYPFFGHIPFLSHFPETNVRTYVTAEDGSRGIWFFSLDASTPLAVAGGRISYRLPYFWSKMRIVKSTSSISYRSARRFRNHRSPSFNATILIGDAYRIDEVSDRDHLLTAQWKLFAHRFNGIYESFAAHPPWKLHRATLESMEQNLLQAAGLPEPASAPVVQFSHGVKVDISLQKKSVSTKQIRRTVMFDGVCNLCNGYVHFLIKRDKRNVFTFGSLQSEAATSLLAEFGYTCNSKLPDSVVYVRGNTFSTHSTAIINIARDLGGIYRGAALFLIIPKVIRDWMYRLLAKNRYRLFGKRDVCMTPTPELKNRFIDSDIGH